MNIYVGKCSKLQLRTHLNIPSGVMSSYDDTIFTSQYCLTDYLQGSELDIESFPST